MGETLVEIITPTVSAVKEAAPDSRGRSVSCCAQQFHFFYHEEMKRTKGYRSLTNERQGRCKSINSMREYVHMKNLLLEPMF